MDSSIKQAQLAIARLERLSPDSLWARRASGCRGTLLRLVEKLKVQRSTDPEEGRPEDMAKLRQALDMSFHILEGAAQERLQRYY